LFVFLFLWCWGLNSGPTPWATPPVLFLWCVFLRLGLSNYLLRLASIPNPPE
jgi:hypothetical protein